MTIELQMGRDPELPQVFGRYLLLQRLSRGGMGEIFVAKHGLAGFEKLVVIKKVLPNLVEDDAFIKRFIDEAQVAIQLQHANIAQVFEVGQIGHEYFLAIEFVQGRDLRRLMRVLADRGQRLPVDHALFVAREVTSGLAYAHRRTDTAGASLNLVHCDISPPNVMVSFEGETKIIDFGIAKSILRQTATDPKLGFGKFGYMSPEQLVRGGVVDHRTDIYAAGVVLFELLTGRRMYEPGDTPDYRALARMVTRGEHPMPSHVDPALAPYDGLVARALRPDPNERYQRAAEFRDAIQTAQVAINPAMNHDHLGSFMRWLFADEVTQQRQALAEALAVDLAPFQAELTLAGEGTVTFAVADLPLRPPAETAIVTRQRARARPRPGWIAAALGLVLVGGLAIAVVAGADGGPSDVAAASFDAGPLAPSDVEGRSGRTDPDAGVAVVAVALPDAAPAGAAVEPAPALRPKARPRPKPRPQPAPPPDDAASQDKVLAKFQSVTREYEKFRKAYGQRLERDWNDLLSYAQYARSSPDKLKTLDKKIDRFRGKMKQASEGG
jgi:hypothetical protein